MFSQLQILMAVLSAVILFLHGLNSFSREIQFVSGEFLKSSLTKLTANRWRGFVFGAVSTMIVQSSSAISALTLSLVQSKIITFRNSLGILMGANLGTTVTAWLVAWKLTGIGPFFIVLGGLLSVLPFRFRFAGRAVFYFGFIFFSLNFIETALLPIRESPEILQMITHYNHPIYGFMVGAFVTVLVQSSSVTTGLVILLAQQRMIDLNLAVPLIMGANIGTTSTALLSSIVMETAARRAAIANLLFNVIGVLLFLPFLVNFVELVQGLVPNLSSQIATAHFIFNLSNSIIFLILLKPFEQLLLYLVPPK